ncbi:recombinase family protein [Nocardia asiatica]|uniref:recombinase family protein n=1 Tax=Nocardia asiatica TaxID=209252 RepID=UPI0024570638|nr:recombinase family protein [Nocardia asiatica]
MPIVPVRAAIYLRVSLDQTGEGLAVERQREDCEAIAMSRGWTVVETYTDNSVSAYNKAKNRPAYDQMVEDYKAGRFNALITWDLDRLTRQPRQLEDWIDAAEKQELRLVTANGEADLQTDGGRMYARIKAAVARAEMERKGARQSRAQRQRAAKGQPPRGIRVASPR